MSKAVTYSSPYEFEGRIPLKQAVPLGLQHVLAMFVGNLTPVLIISGACGIAAGSELQIALLQNVLAYPDEFYLTAAAQKNRNHAGPFVKFENISFAMEEVLFDPQTSGGLLLAVAPEDAEAMAAEMQQAGLPAAIVGEIREKTDIEILVK